MERWSSFRGAGPGAHVVAAGISALAVVWSTNWTLRTQREASRQERAQAAEDEFDRALKRASKQVFTATNLLNMTEGPEHPYFTLDHGDLDNLLTFAQFSAEITFSVEKLSSALRRYNAQQHAGETSPESLGSRGRSCPDG